jgi:hypothetical protein
VTPSSPAGDPFATAAPLTGRDWEAPAAGARSRWSTRALLPSYEAYCRHQVRELLSLLPAEGVRALYRAARAKVGRTDEVADPMALLDEFVTRRLPLPPFHVWCQDVREYPHAHLDAPWMEHALPDRSGPLVIAVREENLRGAPCRTELCVYYADEGWRGHLRFTRRGEERSWQTGDVFREAEVQTIVDRFNDFGWLTLEAFLRSILP